MMACRCNFIRKCLNSLFPPFRPKSSASKKNQNQKLPLLLCREKLCPVLVLLSDDGHDATVSSFTYAVTASLEVLFTHWHHIQDNRSFARLWSLSLIFSSIYFGKFHKFNLVKSALLAWVNSFHSGSRTTGLNIYSSSLPTFSSTGGLSFFNYLNVKHTIIIFVFCNCNQ